MIEKVQLSAETVEGSDQVDDETGESDSDDEIDNATDDETTETE